jgi:predicted nucleic acid-binding protein
LNGWLFDTDVLSALAPGRSTLPQRVAGWVERHSDELYIPMIAVAEVTRGISERRRAGAHQRAQSLSSWLDRIKAAYEDRILPFDLAAADLAGAIDDNARAEGRHPGFPDVAVAAIALSRDLVLLTRNRRHYMPLGVELFDPFDAS